MSEQSLVESLDRLSLNQLSKSSPSRLPPFQLKRSRSNQTPVPPLPGSNHHHQQHDSSPTSPPPPSSKHSNNNNNNKSSNLSHVPCKFFKQGTCTAGANCIFSHNPDPTSESAVCKYFLKGNCKFGSKCALLHTLSPYTPDGRKLLMSQHRNNGAVAGAQSIASRSVGDTLSLRSPPLGSPIDFGPHMFSPVRGAAAAATGGFFDQSRYDMLSTSADARISGFSHLSAAIHRQQDPFMFAEEQQQRRYSPRDAFFGGGGGIRASTSPRETSELSSSPFTQRTLFMHPTSSPSASASMLSSSLSRTGSSFHQQTALHSIPERSQSTSRFLDVPHHNSYYGTGDYLDLEDADDDLNDAMLPSSLNELLTPTELQLRKAREQQRQQQLGGGAGGGLSRGHSYASVVDRSPSESMLGFHHRSPLDMAHSPSLGLTHSLSPSSSPWQQLPIFADDDQQQLPSARGAINIPKGVKSEAPVIGLEEESYRRKKLLDNTGPFSPFDDDGPFYMEEANGTDADSQEQQQQQQQQRHTTPFEFPSLISIQKSS